jgi:hypothetical protein
MRRTLQDRRCYVDQSGRSGHPRCAEHQARARSGPGCV